MKLIAIASIGLLFLASNASAAAITHRASTEDYHSDMASSDPAQSTLSNLQVTLSLPEEATTPPTIIVNLTNTHPKLPITFVDWDSPIARKPIHYGLLSITPPGSSTPMDLSRFRIDIYRLMPNSSEELVTLEPGEKMSQTSELASLSLSLSITGYPVLEAKTKSLQEGFMEEMRGDGSGPVKIQMKGGWAGVWVGKRKEEVVDSGVLEDFDTYSKPLKTGMLRGRFESNVVELELK